MTGFDFDGLKRAMEGSDAAALGKLYAEDAEMTIVDSDRPPGTPMRVRGRTAILAYWEDVCGRAMTHNLAREVIGPERVAFVEECAYPDGCNVLAAMTLDLRDGQIARHLTVQAWDQTAP
jgi:ketosteroid isomerase-like protein